MATVTRSNTPIEQEEIHKPELIDYTTPDMNREQTLEAMLKACLDIIDYADDYFVSFMVTTRGAKIEKFIDSKKIREYINYPNAKMSEE